MDYRICSLALALVPLALTVGCEKKQSKEDIIAEYEASKLEEARVERLEQELADIKASQAEDSAAKEGLIKAQEKLIQDARQKAAQAAKAAEEAKAAPAPQPTPDVAQNEGKRGGPRSEEGGRRPASKVIAQGTELAVTLSQELTTDTHEAGASWSGSLAQPVSVDGSVVWAAGTSVSGTVIQSAPTGRLSTGEGALAIKLTDVGGSSIDGGLYAVTVDSKGSRNAKVIGTTAALGAIIGAISKKSHQTDSALGGAAIGAAVGTAVAAGTANTVVRIPVGTITFEIPATETVVVRNR
jgi:hypothetical protein